MDNSLMNEREAFLLQANIFGINADRLQLDALFNDVQGILKKIELLQHADISNEEPHHYRPVS
ncbi:MAG: hypothetical protein CL763_03375 [Chloroflexi bacterium]|nr:hypothetical protein [Chloroflexota bacterium]|tara:strand:- start:2109 stop:2297 length:189 start_codon:yes stop_codon:yes gene_type:complete